jgi:hypothetical protein
MKANAANADMYASIATVMQPKPDLILQFSASTKKKKKGNSTSRHDALKTIASFAFDASQLLNHD